MQETSATSSLAVRIRNLSKSYGTVVAIRDITFDVVKGSFVTLLGPSGCGKTTILRCIAGVEEPDSGSIEIDARVVFSSDPKLSIPSEDRNIGMVFQSCALWPHMKIFDNIAYPLKVRRTPKEEIKKRVDDLSALLEISELQDRIPAELSGGQQQRVALARALVYNPEILLLDEPLSNLDEQLRYSVRDDLKALQHRIGVTTIYVTHDRVEALSLSDKIILMSKGRVEVQGTPRGLLDRPPSSYAASFLGGMLVLDGTVSVVKGDAITTKTEFGEITGKTDGALFQSSESIKVCIKSSALYPLEKKSLDEKNAISGVVKGFTIDPERNWYQISFANQTIMVPQPSDIPPRKAGDTINLRIPESAVYFVRS